MTENGHHDQKWMRERVEDERREESRRRLGMLRDEQKRMEDEQALSPLAKFRRVWTRS